MGQSPSIYIFNRHQELLRLWRQLGCRGIRLIHLDEHCDLRGAFVHRGKQSLFPLKHLGNVDDGNFLVYAVKEGIVSRIRWIHDEYGGRNRDVSHVKYETDITAFFSKVSSFFPHHKKYPLLFSEELSTGEFTISPEEVLDIDWDYFASVLKTPEQRRASVQRFLARPFPSLPRTVYISYSPDCVLRSEHEFEEFIGLLRNTFRANVVRPHLPVLREPATPTNYRKYILPLYWRIRRHIFWPLKRVLNKWGIY